MRFSVHFCAPLALLAALTSFAGQFSSETAVGDRYLAEFLSYQARILPTLAWNLGLSYSQLRNENESVLTRTTGIQMGAGWEQQWLARVDLGFALSPADRYHQLGPSVELGRRFELGAPNESGFAPTIELRGLFSYLRFTQSFNNDTGSRPEGRRARRVSQTTGTEAIAQTGAGLEIATAPWAWLSTRFYYLHYTYDRNLDAFLEFLDSPRAVRAGAAGFSSVLSSFPSQTFGFGFLFSVGSRWQLGLDGIRSRNALDGSDMDTARAQVWYELNTSWTLGLGTQREISSGESDTMGLASVTFSP
jgi:hypothetical protein